MGDDELKKECIGKEKPNLTEVEQFRLGKFTSPSENLKCYVKCIAEKAGYFKHGKFVDDKIKELFSTSPKKVALLAAYEECKKHKGASDCDTVFQTKQCVAKIVMT